MYPFVFVLTLCGNIKPSRRSCDTFIRSSAGWNLICGPGSVAAQESWKSASAKQLPPPPPLTTPFTHAPSPNRHPRPGPQRSRQMVGPWGQVLFSFVIHLPPPFSAKQSSDRNPPVMLAQSSMGNKLQRASVKHYAQWTREETKGLTRE